MFQHPKRPDHHGMRGAKDHDHQPKGFFDILLRDGPVPVITAMLVLLLSKVVPKEPLVRTLTAVNPTKHMASDPHASERAVYLMVEHGWKLEFAAADPRWLSRGGRIITLLYSPLIVLNTVLMTGFYLAVDVLTLVLELVTTLWWGVSGLARVVTRILFWDWELRDAERCAVSGDAKDAIMRRMAMKKGTDPDRIPVHVRLEYDEHMTKTHTLLAKLRERNGTHAHPKKDTPA